MTRIKEVHRPKTVAEALSLLARSDRSSAALAGGTYLVPRLGEGDDAMEALVDLALLKLDDIEHERGSLSLGAMATLADVTQNEACLSAAGGLLSRAARLSADVNVRNAATVGGAVVSGDPTSQFLMALLLLDAEVVIQTVDGEHVMPLGGFLQAPTQMLNHGLLMEVRFFLPEGNVGAGWARVGRTPRDRPIVAAGALMVREDNVATRVNLALSGVADVPIRVMPVEAALAGRPFSENALTEALNGLKGALNPPADFRGSAEYRQAMAPILARRALREAWASLN